MKPMTDDELSAVLHKWGPVHAPSGLEAQIFGPAKRASQRSSSMLFRSIRVPVPMVAMTVVALVGLSVWSVVERPGPSRPPDLPGGADAAPVLSRLAVDGSSAILDDAVNPSATAAAPVQQNAAAPERIKVSAHVQEMKAARKVPPVYPSDAKAKRIEGTVVLHAIIATNGTVKELTVLSGDPVFRPATIKAVKQWRYKPTLLNGRPAEVDTTITVNYRLGG
jgi:TonB family protein